MLIPICPKTTTCEGVNGRNFNDKIVGRNIEVLKELFLQLVKQKMKVFNLIKKLIEELSKIKILLIISLLLFPDINYDAPSEHPHIRYSNSDHIRVNAIITGHV